MLTASNYFDARDDCEMTCPIGAGHVGYGVRHNTGCGAVAGTGHNYRETIARAADALLPIAEPTGGMFVLLVGQYADETIIGVTRAAGPAAANMVAATITAKRAEGYTIDSGPLAGVRGHYARDLVHVRAEPVAEFDGNGEVTR